MVAEPRPAATVVLLREARSGPEVLLLKRSTRLGFFPSAWVFPGGRVDPEDARIPARGDISGLPATDRAIAAAAVRECFEECGIWLGEGQPTDGLRAALNQRGTTARIDAATGLVADLGRLAFWARWITPLVEPRRYDTWFMIAALSPEEADRAAHDEGETTASLWIRPAEAIQRAASELFLAPPTFRTLEELARHQTVGQVLAAAAHRPRAPIMPRLLQAAPDWTLCLPGDPEYPSEHPAPGAKRIVMRDGRWRSEG